MDAKETDFIADSSEIKEEDKNIHKEICKHSIDTRFIE